MKPDQHHRLSRTAAGTDGGALLRHGWMPVALRDELHGAGTPYPMLPLRVLGQDLLLWVDALGRVGLLDRACPHRGTDLALGQHEGDGLRCALHGWKFDIDGHCLDIPGEPAGSALCRRMRQRSYAVQQRGGMVFAWLGPADTPPDTLPALHGLDAPPGHALRFKTLWRCNWLQALEIGLDPLAAQSHAAMNLHVDVPAQGLLRWTALRPMDDAQMHVRIGQALCPHIVELPLSQNLTLTRWHAPVDDAHTAVYSLVTSFDAPFDAQALLEDAVGQREQRLAESMEADHDRAREHLASSDKAIVACRRQLLKAMDALRFGDRPPSAAAALQAVAGGDLDVIECVVPARDWQRHCRQAVAARRERSAWVPA